MYGPTSSAFAQSGNAVPIKANNHNYALIVGISDYKYIRPLSFADKDAQLFLRLFAVARRWRVA
jgi:hypothetical protein